MLVLNKYLLSKCLSQFQGSKNRSWRDRQYGRYGACLCTQLTQVQPPSTSEKHLGSPPQVIPECRTRIQPWELGVCPPRSPKNSFKRCYLSLPTLTIVLSIHFCFTFPYLSIDNIVFIFKPVTLGDNYNNIIMIINRNSCPFWIL